jgi:hypothetical protein
LAGKRNNTIVHKRFRRRQVYIGIRTTDGNWISTNTSSAISPGSWYYLAATWKKNDYLRLYVNEDVINPVSCGNVFLYDYSSSIPARIGTNVDVGGPFFDGVIDEVRVSNAAHSAPWLKASYNSGADSLLVYGDEEAL